MGMENVYDFLKKKNKKLTTVEISDGVDIGINSVRKNLENLLIRNLVVKTLARYRYGVLFLWETK